MTDHPVPAVALDASAAPAQSMRGSMAGALHRWLHRAVAFRTAFRVRMPAAPEIGMLGGAGCLLLVAGVVAWFSVLEPLRRDVADLREEVVLVESRARDARREPATPEMQATVLLRRLPTRAELPDLLRTVVAQAAGAGLRLERGDYEFTVSKSGLIARYVVTLPVTGTYLQVQKFVEGTLESLPAVALEGLRLERDSVGSAELRASLQFAVLVRSEP